MTTYYSTSSPLINVFNALTVAGSSARKSIWMSPVFEFSNDGSHSFIIFRVASIVSSAKKWTIKLNGLHCSVCYGQRWVIYGLGWMQLWMINKKIDRSPGKLRMTSLMCSNSSNDVSMILTSLSLESITISSLHAILASVLFRFLGGAGKNAR